ncbi:MAG: hypothetical protein JNJ73_11655 [Hyphomonadaceae bacterium]|nr:hypothetical protein [Hyphomonadaceae bacterium]
MLAQRVAEPEDCDAAAPASAAPNAPCIYLINQISGHGHLDMYARLYSKCLLENGYRVLLLSQHDPGVKQWLTAQSPALAARFVCLTRDGVAAPPPERAQQSPERRAPPGGLRGALGNALRAWRADGLEAVRDLYDAKRHPPLPFGVPFGHLANEMRMAERHSGWPPAFALFLYLDMMGQEAESCRDLDALGVPWAGIRFHPNGSYREKFRAERYFLGRYARGAIFLNPQSIPAYRRKFPHLHFASFPDVTDAATLPAPSPFVTDARRRASGRKMVLQLGTLSPHKGVFDLIALIKRADPKRFFFVIAGEVFWSHYGDREQELRDFLESPPENVLVRIGYLEDERELNTLIEACDCLYAVYKQDFYNSSNTMTKASVFERPVLVSEKFLMGERVDRYRIGEVVRPGDVGDALFWLEEMAARPHERFGFEAFRRNHSIEALNAALPAALERWLHGPQKRGFSD